MDKISKILQDALHGVMLLDLNPHTDYRKYISTPQEISNRAWQRTCRNFCKATDKIGQQYKS